MFGLGLSLPELAMRRTGSGGAVVANGAISAAFVRDTTYLDPDNGGTPVGIDGNGWVATITLKGLTALAASLIDPTAFVLTVTDPGYDTSGNATTVNRTIRGRALLRGQWIDATHTGARRMISQSGSDTVLHLVLDDYIYAGTYNLQCSITTGFYTGCVASSATVTNSSTLAYKKAAWGWINQPYECVRGSTYYVEGMPFSRYASNGQQVACVKYQAMDGTNTGATVVVGAPTLSTLVTQNAIPECYAATVDISAMTQGAVCNINAKVYPWIGDSSAILDLSVDGFNTGYAALANANPQTPLRFCCDKNSTYGIGHAAIKLGASGGTVQLTQALARTTPFPTPNAAKAALAAYHNINAIPTHNDSAGGTMWAMDDGAGGAVAHIATANIAGGTGNALTDIRTDNASAPGVSFLGNSGGAVTYFGPTTGKSNVGMMRFKGVALVTSTTTNLLWDGGTLNYDVLAFANCTIDTTNGNYISGFGLRYFINTLQSNTPTSITNCIMYNGGTAAKRAQTAAMIGCTPKSSSTSLASTIYCFVANTITGGTNMPGDPGGIGTYDAYDGLIHYNNKVVGATSVGPALGASTNPISITRTAAIVQNLLENIGAAAGIRYNLMADGSSGAIYDVVESHMLITGDRGSRCYEETSASRGQTRAWVTKYGIYDNWNIKTDTYINGFPGNTGNWAYMYTVGHDGNCTIWGSKSGATPNLNGGLQPPTTGGNNGYMGHAWPPNSVIAQGNFTPFTSYQAANSNTSSAGAGSGDYHLAGPYGSNPFCSRVPANMGVLKYDIEGNARYNDGTDAAGPYRRP